jgi:hypothetical protein
MLERDNSLSTDQKALAVNLDKYKYGAIVEIGAGQEVARRFFHVGAAAGTIAKTMSAYDMAISDEVYGHVDRYVSRARLLQMLDKEYTQVVERLTALRDPQTTFFAYAATVTARSFRQKNECHGWVGMRLQLSPGAPPNDIILHVRMLDNDNEHQSEALGILGVNLIHGAFFLHQEAAAIIEGLSDGLGQERIEVDLIDFSGQHFAAVENHLMNLQLIRSKLTRAVVFNPAGAVVVPGELFHHQPVLVMRGCFRPVTCIDNDMMTAGRHCFGQLDPATENQIVSLAEITMSSLCAGDQLDGADFLARIQLLASQGYTVMISDYVRFFRLRAYLRRYTQQPIGIVLSVRAFESLFDEAVYEGLEGGILEAFGKLFPDNTHVYIYPSRINGPAGSTVLTLENVQVPAKLRHLFAHLVENEKLIAIEPLDNSHLHIDDRDVLACLQSGQSDWQDCVPAEVARCIVDGQLLGYRCT